MTIYEAIKAEISVKQDSEHYDLKVSRNAMTCCPFHDDWHPNMKLNEDYFFCLSRGAKGDVFDLVAKLFDLSSFEAAQRIAANFGIGNAPEPAVTIPPKTKRAYIRQFRENEILCFRVLTDYLHLLEDWKWYYALKTPNDEWDDHFVEACQMLDYIEYLADILAVGNLEKWVAIVDELSKEGKAAFQQNYVARKRKKVVSYEEEK